MDSHYDTQEEAQAAVDAKNKEIHGILPGMNSKGVDEVRVSEEAFDTVFYDSFNDQGFPATATPVYLLAEDLGDNADGRAFKEVYEALPENIRIMTEDSENVYLVKEGNIDEHVRQHYLSPREGGDRENKGFNEMVEDLRRIDPSQIDEDDEIKDGPLKDDLVNFISEKSLDEATLEVNGNRVAVSNLDSLDRNWVQEYVDSGRFDKAKSQ